MCSNPATNLGKSVLMGHWMPGLDPHPLKHFLCSGTRFCLPPPPGPSSQLFQDPSSSPKRLLGGSRGTGGIKAGPSPCRSW